MTIDYFSLGHPLSGFRSHFALKGRKWMYDLFVDVTHPGPSSRILDLGVTPDRSLPESNFFEKFYPYKNRLTAVGIEDAGFLEEVYPGLKFVRIQSGPLPFVDDEFDILFCSAVIEHVGSHESQRNFLREALRVTRQFYFTTPNRQFPLEFHTFLPFIHWLPQRMHQAVLRRLGLDFWSRTENLNLLAPKKFLDLFPPCSSLHLVTYKLVGLPSNIIVYGKK
jgi:SAM-dependent methyltransferase